MFAHSTIVVAGPGQGVYLSERLVAGRSLLFLDTSLFDLPEAAQFDTILSLAAACVLKVRHESESAQGSGTCDSFDLMCEERWEEFEAEMSYCKGERADIQVEARFGMKRARELARSWGEEWQVWVERMT